MAKSATKHEPGGKAHLKKAMEAGTGHLPRSKDRNALAQTSRHVDSVKYRDEALNSSYSPGKRPKL